MMSVPVGTVRRVLVAGLAAACFVYEGEASAATITLVHDTGGQCTTATKEITDVIAGTTQDTTCMTTTAGGTYSAFESTRAFFDPSGLLLGAGLTLDATSTTSAFLSATATALFEDTVTLVGGTTGTLGWLELTFDVTGSITSDGTGSALGYVDFYLDGTFAGRRTFTGSTTVTATLPFLFGQAGEFGVALNAFAVARLGPTSGTEFEADVNFLNTATLLGVQVLDANKNVLPDGQVVSSSNLTYPSLTAPEPATLALLSAGLATFAVRRRRATRR